MPRCSARVEQITASTATSMLALWGIESGYGEVIDNPKYMRPVIPALAALACGEPRRRSYWEAELLNALVIIERGWSEPRRDDRLVGRRHGSHPVDARSVAAHGRRLQPRRPYLAVRPARRRACRHRPFLLDRGSYRRGEAWGCEVRLPHGAAGGGARAAMRSGENSASRAPTAQPFPRPGDQARLEVPVAGGPAFLIGQNFSAVIRYNPASNYTLAIAISPTAFAAAARSSSHSRAASACSTLAEVQEIPAAPDRARLRHRRHRRAGRPRHPARRAGLSAKGRHRARRRLCRSEGAGEVAPRRVIGLHRVSRADRLNQETNSMTRCATRARRPRQGGRARSDTARDRAPGPIGRECAGFGSDVVADTLRALDIPYIALNPGASYRGLHDSLVNYLGNARPQMLLCLHEEIAVAIAHGYAKVTGRADGGGRAFQCRPVACHHGVLQRLVRPHADHHSRRNRPGRCGEAAAMDRLDSHRRRPGRDHPQLHQMGRPAGLACGGPRSVAARLWLANTAPRARSTSISTPRCRKRSSRSRCPHRRRAASCRRSPAAAPAD